jgi:hypothetical protein
MGVDLGFLPRFTDCPGYRAIARAFGVIGSPGSGLGLMVSWSGSSSASLNTLGDPPDRRS